MTVIDRTELLRLIDQEDAQVVDVLPDREYNDSHISGAVSLLLRNFTTATVLVLQRDKPVVVY